MKLFLKRDTDSEKARFVVFDDKGNEKYVVIGKTGNSKQTMYISDRNKNRISTITLFELNMKYFSIRCNKKLYALIPCIKDKFAFIIYGSTFRFAGDIVSGRFSLIDVDKSTVMTQKRYWNSYGDGFEIEIFSDEQEIFMLSVAICAAMYVVSGGSNPIAIT